MNTSSYEKQIEEELNCLLSTKESDINQVFVDFDSDIYKKLETYANQQDLSISEACYKIIFEKLSIR